METIKQRANKAFPIIVSVGDDEYISKTAPIERKAYIMGATEQKQIDIDKACEALDNMRSDFGWEMQDVEKAKDMLKAMGG